MQEGIMQEGIMQEASLEDEKAIQSEIGKINGENTCGGKCPFSSPRVMAFLLPFFAVLALEQWAASSNTCVSAVACQMCIVSKSALALAAGMIGLGLQKKLSRR